MGVILTEHVSDDFGTLIGLAGCIQMQFVHGVQNAAVNRLKTIAHIRQCAADYNRHGVIDVCFFDFLVNRLNYQRTAFRRFYLVFQSVIP